MLIAVLNRNADVFSKHKADIGCCPFVEVTSENRSGPIDSDADQGLAQSLARAAKESEERDIRMTREIGRLLNDHDNTYAHTMTSLEKRLDANLT